MARITVEDCIDKFTSRFELVLVASNRARKLHSGENPTVDRDNDKNTVIALREIAQETITQDQLKNDLIEEYQTVSIAEDELTSEENLIEDNNETQDEENLETNSDQIDNKLDAETELDSNAETETQAEIETELESNAENEKQTQTEIDSNQNKQEEIK
tara:strand:+ start:49 stop:525 length:477 start_codon:yes stop_codon:yes gene_type:complete